MFDFNYQKGNLIGRTCLELSLKPFKEFDEASINDTCRTLFYGWQKLLDKSESIAVMLWTADGSEILEYTGDMSQSFEYCDVIGNGNPTKKPPYHDAEKNNLHVRSVPYNGERKVMTYEILAHIISSIKRVGEELTGKNISVIETFDPGPEFAKSDFKYNRHTEICKGNIMGTRQWLHCASRLHAEDRAYAAYPNGIPECTHFGEFLGRQFMCLARDVGFDNIWLSNGFGFSLSSWNWIGEVFDGERFDTSGVLRVKDSINEFWKYFTKETGDMLIEARGSNLSTAMDISAHGCPIDDIYSYNMLTPPNSPWAALDSRFGLELCGYLSHIAETSENGFLFRYYTHDPWWYNSPWFDRYGRSPHDIYLPLALARLDGEGKVTKPFGVNFLSADDSFGNLPEKCPNEVIPHILEGFDSYSDAPGLVTWLYPFESYCDVGLRKGHPETILMDDWFMESAIDFGFPVNSVISDKSFMTAEESVFSETVIATPVPSEGSLAEKCVMKAICGGLPVILYGSTKKASEELRKLIGVSLAKPIDGELCITQSITADTYSDGKLSDSLLHIPLVSDGGICEVASKESECFASVIDKDGNVRSYGMFNKERKLVWLRGSFPHDSSTKNSHLPSLIKPETHFPPALLMRCALRFFGIEISYNAMYPSDKLPINLFSRHNGALYRTGFAKDTTITMCLSFPDGVPMPIGSNAIIDGGVGTFALSGWCHDECRTFVKQKSRSKVTCRMETAGDTMLADRRIGLYGLTNAEITFLPPKDSVVYICKTRNITEVELPDEIRADGKCVFRGVSGNVCILWQSRETEREYRENGYII